MCGFICEFFVNYVASYKNIINTVVLFLNDKMQILLKLLVKSIYIYYNIHTTNIFVYIS